MKSKLLMSAIAMPAALAFGTAAIAQETTPPPGEMPSTERMETNPAPSDTPAPAPEATPAPSEAPAPAPDEAAEATDPSAGTFATNQEADEWRSSRLVGMAVYNGANERVGDINDLLFDENGQIEHAVIGVGGFLGIGEKLVAASFKDLSIQREQDGSVRVTMNTTKEALQNAPEFKYEDDGALTSE